MYQQIEKLKKEREKLTVEYKTNQIEFKAEIKRINSAIRNFEKGINQLNGVVKPKRVKSSSEIEKIFEEAELPLRYWYSVVNRETSGIERFIKRKSSSDSREEKGSASIWFVRAAYLIVLSWVLLVFFLYIGHVELATFK